MTVLQYLATVVLTALGGFDPVPALIAAAALTAGVRRRHVLASTILLVAGTAALGLVLTLLAGPRLAGVDWHTLVRGGRTSAWVELVLGVGIGSWAVYRARRRPRREPAHGGRSPWALYVTAIGFVAVVVFDLPFDVLVTTSTGQPLLLAAGGWGVWAVLSQAPVTALAIAVAAGRHAGAMAFLDRVRSRLGPLAGVVITACLAVAAVLLVADATQFLARGRFLIP